MTTMRFTPVMCTVPKKSDGYYGFMATVQGRQRTYAIVAPDMQTLEDIWIENVTEDLDRKMVQRVTILNQRHVKIDDGEARPAAGKINPR
jgi:hypothetical protein